MSDPVVFPSTTSTFALPLLFSGQAQREFFVNQSLSVIDALMQFAVIDIVGTLPQDPGDADCYIVAAGAAGDWTGKEDQIAIRLAGDWLFIMPHDHMQVINRATGQKHTFSSGWVAPAEPQVPTGGSVIDNEARTAIADLIDALRVAGVFATPA